MAEKEYKEMMNILLEKDFEKLTPTELELVESYLESNDILNDSFTVSEMIDSVKDEEKSIELNSESLNFLSQEFDKKHGIKTSDNQSVLRTNKFKRLTYYFAGAAAAVMLVVVLLPKKETSSYVMEDDFFIANTQFIDMDITANEDLTNNMMKMDFIEE